MHSIDIFQRLPDVGPLTSVSDEGAVTTSLAAATIKEESPAKNKKISETLDVSSTPAAATPGTPVVGGREWRSATMLL